jgi:hypothetical protein
MDGAVRPRAAGGYEPDEAEQQELVSYYHTARTALAGMRNADGNTIDTRSNRVNYAVDEFIKAHAHAAPAIARKWVYVWATDNLGLIAPGLTHAKARRTLVGKIKLTPLYRRVLSAALKHPDGIASSGGPRTCHSLRQAGYLESIGTKDGRSIDRITQVGKEAMAAWQNAQQVAPSPPK